MDFSRVFCYNFTLAFLKAVVIFPSGFDHIKMINHCMLRKVSVRKSMSFCLKIRKKLMNTNNYTESKFLVIPN